METTTPTWDPRRDLALPVGGVLLLTLGVLLTRPPAKLPGVDACGSPEATTAALEALAASRWMRGRQELAVDLRAGTAGLDGASAPATFPMRSGLPNIEWVDPEATDERRHRVRVNCVPFAGWRIDDTTAELWVDEELGTWIRVIDAPYQP